MKERLVGKALTCLEKQTRNETIKIEFLVVSFRSTLGTIEEIIHELEGRSQEVIQNTIQINKKRIEAGERLIHQLNSGSKEKGLRTFVAEESSPQCERCDRLHAAGVQETSAFRTAVGAAPRPGSVWDTLPPRQLTTDCFITQNKSQRVCIYCSIFYGVYSK